MTYKVLFHIDAAKEIARWDNRVKLRVLKQINKLSITPGLGSDLGNRHGINLPGYRKLYADKKNIRIVYKIVDEKVLVQIIAIGKREAMEVSQKAATRLQE